MKRLFIFTLLIVTACFIFAACNKSDEPTHEHVYKVTVTDPTDTQRGYKTYLCECGESYVSEGELASDGLLFSLNSDNTYTLTGLYNSSDVSIVIPSHYKGLPVVAIADNAFKHLPLVNVTIPATVERIGHLALAATSNFTSIEVSEGNQHFTSIDGVLYSKDTRTLVQYPVGRDATAFEIPSHVSVIGGGAFFDSSALTEISIPAGVTSIGKEAFKDCESITDLRLPEALTEIGAGAFENCYNLKTVNVPNSVASIGERAFCHCESLKAVNIPEGIESIGDFTFYACYELTTVIIPNSVKSIGVSAFEWCDGLTGVQMSAVQSIGDNAFCSCKMLGSIYLPGSLTYLGEWAFGWCDNLASVNIPASIGVIRSNAFYMCRSLELIEIPEGITEIGDMAFFECDALTSISIPASVTSIGDRALSGCLSLSTIKVSEDNEDYVSYSGALYTHNGKTLIQYAVGRANTHFIVAASVEEIAAGAFSGAENLTEVLFENTSGWVASGFDIPSEDLIDLAKAAYLLTSRYTASVWTRA